MHRSLHSSTFVVLLFFLFILGCAESLNQWEGSLDAQFAYRESESLTFVHEVKSNTFCHEAGLKSGDILIAIDKKSIKGASMPEVLSALRGPVGTMVVLTIERGDKTMDISVERRPISKKPFGPPQKVI